MLGVVFRCIVWIYSKSWKFCVCSVTLFLLSILVANIEKFIVLTMHPCKGNLYKWPLLTRKMSDH